MPEPGSSLSDQLFGEPPILDPWQARESSMSAPPSSTAPPGRLRALLVPDPARTASLVLLLVRLSAGLLLVPHGVYKLLGGVNGLAAGLASRGAPAPLVLAWCATLAEAVGGLLVAIGLLTRPAAAAACATMVVAWATSHLGDAIRIGTAKGGVFEYPFLLSLLFLTIAVAGPGRYSVDARI
jgi:putative oxidoreductase